MKKRPQPPIWIDKLLHWRLPKGQLEEVQGNMHELYHHWIKEMDSRKATRLYLLHALTFRRPLPRSKRVWQLKFNSYSQATPLDMLANYLKIALRTLWRNKAFSLINILGLSLGLACSLLIWLYVSDEQRYDRFHVNGKQLYRVMAHLHWGQVTTNETTPNPLSQVMEEQIPKIKQVVRTSREGQALFTVKRVIKNGGGCCTTIGF